MVEKWRPVVGYEGLYEVSNLGRIKSLPRHGTNGGLVKYSFSNSKHYAHAPLTKNGKLRTVSVHRIVAEAWIENPLHKEQVNHIDGNKKNNSISNLEWVTNAENMRHSVKIGLRDKAIRDFIEKRKVKVERINPKTGHTKIYESVISAQRDNGVHNQNIIKVCQGKRHTAGGFAWIYVGE